MTSAAPLAQRTVNEPGRNINEFHMGEDRSGDSTEELPNVPSPR